MRLEHAPVGGDVERVVLEGVEHPETALRLVGEQERARAVDVLLIEGLAKVRFVAGGPGVVHAPVDAAVGEAREEVLAGEAGGEQALLDVLEALVAIDEVVLGVRALEQPALVAAGVGVEVLEGDPVRWARTEGRGSQRRRSAPSGSRSPWRSRSPPRAPCRRRCGRNGGLPRRRFPCRTGSRSRPRPACRSGRRRPRRSSDRAGHPCAPGSSGFRGSGRAAVMSSRRSRRSGCRRPGGRSCVAGTEEGSARAPSSKPK